MNKYVIPPQPLNYPPTSTDPSLPKDESSKLALDTVPAPTEGMDRKRHLKLQTSFPFREMSSTPSPDYVAMHPDLLPVRRKLFSNETKSDGMMTMGKEGRSMNETEMVNKYGMGVPSHILGPNGPKLIKRNLAFI